MSMRCYVSFIVVCLCVSGCRQDPYLDAYLETLRAEKLWLEDKFYDLEQQYDVQVAELDTYRTENRSLRQQLGIPDADPSQILPSSSNPEGAALEEPEIEFGTPSSPQIEGATMSSSSSTEVRPLSNLNAPASFESWAPTGDQSVLVGSSNPLDTRVTHIVLNPHLTSGHDFDRKPGDDGISVVFEPRNADDQFVPVAGPVSIVILDPLLDGEAARVARWDFEADEIRHRLKTEVAKGRGINLMLPWPKQQPQNTRFLLFVRYTTEDGRKLEADTELFIVRSGQFSHRWTPKSTRPSEGLGTLGDKIPSVEQQNDVDGRSQLATHVETNPLAVSPTSGVFSADDHSSPAAHTASQQDWRHVPSDRPKRPVWQPFR